MFCRSLLFHLSFLWLLYSLYFFDLRLLITPLVCCGHCAVCPSSMHDFWLPLWYLRYTASDYLPLVSSIYGFWLPPFGVFYLRLLITHLVSSNLSYNTGRTFVGLCFCIVFVVHCLCLFFWSLYCLSFFVFSFLISLWYLHTFCMTESIGFNFYSSCVGIYRQL